MSPALETDVVSTIRELRYQDGLTARQVALRVGCCEATVWGYAPGRPGKIDNALLREAFEGSGLSGTAVARRVGWFCAGTWGERGDGSRVRRTLGLIDDVDGAGRRARRRFIDAEMARLLAEAIGVMPWEVGA